MSGGGPRTPPRSARDGPPAFASEDDAIARVLSRVPACGPGIRVGPGHDCASLVAEGGELVVTTDVLVDGVHFRLEECGPEAAAEKSLLVNLSDLAAAAAAPIAFEVGVVLPRGSPPDLLLGLAEGFRRAALRWACPCAGGDTNVAGGALVLAVTAFGTPGPLGVVTRAGARPGDVLSVTGPLGGSLAGRHLSFPPRVPEALALARLGIPHAMMDLSDGISRDLPRLCRMSGVGARVDADLVPVHPDVARAPDRRPPLQHALDDGEDFELLVAHAPLPEEVRRRLAAEGVTLLPIGEVRPAVEGIRLAFGSRGGGPRDGPSSVPLAARGYDHFAQPGPPPAEGAP